MDHDLELHVYKHPRADSKIYEGALEGVLEFLDFRDLDPKQVYMGWTKELERLETSCREEKGGVSVEHYLHPFYCKAFDRRDIPVWKLIVTPSNLVDSSYEYTAFQMSFPMSKRRLRELGTSFLKQPRYLRSYMEQGITPASIVVSSYQCTRSPLLNFELGRLTAWHESIHTLDIQQCKTDSHDHSGCLFSHRKDKKSIVENAFVSLKTGRLPLCNNIRKRTKISI